VVSHNSHANILQTIKCITRVLIQQTTICKSISKWWYLTDTKVIAKFESTTINNARFKDVFVGN